MVAAAMGWPRDGAFEEVFIMKDSKETLQQYVGDMLAVDRHIHDTVKRHRDDKQVQADAEAHQLLSRVESTFDILIEELEQLLNRLGGSASSPVKEAVASTLGALGSMYDKVRTETVSKMLRDDYVTLGLAAISYTMLNTTGHALHDEATAATAARHLRQITPLITGISRLMPLVVARELGDDHQVDVAAAPQSVRETQQAWSAEVTGQNIYA
jgi:hypothetical protein